MKNVIVTGANGFIGSSLIKLLIEKEINVYALDISFNNSKLPNSNNITKIETSLNNVDDLMLMLPKINYDAMYHLAWKGVNGPSKADPIIQLQNAEIAMNCAKVAKQLGVQKLLCAGTIAERAIDSLSDLHKTSGGMMYGVAKHCTHLMLETFCKSIDLEFIWMQFSNIYGPSNKTGNLVSYTINELKNDNVAMFGPALQAYDFIFVDDLLEAVYRLGESKTKRNCYFIGSGEPRQLKEYLSKIGELCGKENLIKIGYRQDDGIKYTFDMFDTTAIKEDIGEFVTMNFNNGIKYTLENF